jgi:ABC-type multidrug transport system fused ATPase/permease subunit
MTETAEPASTADAIAFSRDLVRPYRKLIAGMMAVLLIETGASLALPWLGGRLADRLLDDGAEGLYALGIVTIAVLLVQLGARIVGRLGIARIGDEMLLDLRRRTFAHLQRLPMAFHDRHKRGDQLSLLTTDAQSLAGFLSGALPGLPPMLLTLAGALAVLGWMRPMLAVVIALVVAAAVAGLKLWMRVIRRRARTWFDSQSETVDLAEQSLEMLPMIKAEAREARQEAAFAERAGVALRHALALRQVLVPVQPVIQLAALAGIITLLIVVAGPFGADPAPPGELVTLLLYGVIVARPLSGLADIYGRWNSARGALARIMETLARAPEHGRGTRIPPERLHYGIRFESVTFGYDPERPVLRDFDLAIAPGERIAVTGPNGSGKTTLVALLMRFYEPQSGRILLDDRPLGEFSLDGLRSRIALVPQRVWLFQGTVADNIRLGWPDAPLERVREAAKLAGAHGFIAEMDGGYDAELGPRGARISGGQQQRLALARALLQPAPVLVLDEATSMFDDEGERSLLERIGPVIENRCLIVITHRPRMLELAHRVIRMEDGRIVGIQGSRYGA